MISEEARSLMESLGDLKDEDVDSFVEKLKALDFDDQRRLEYVALRYEIFNSRVSLRESFVRHIVDNRQAHRDRALGNPKCLGLEEFIEGKITWEEYINYGKSK